MNSETMEHLQVVYNEARSLMRKHYGDGPNLTLRTHIKGYSKNPDDLSQWKPCLTLDAYRNVDGKVDRSFKLSVSADTWGLAVGKLASTVSEHFHEMELECHLATDNYDRQGLNNGAFFNEESAVGQFAAIAERLENSILGIHERLDKLEQGGETEESHDH